MTNAIDWSLLTRIPDKERLYRHDGYFREALDEVRAAFGAGAAELLWRSALLVVTPDGLATAQLGAILGYLARHDFSVVALAEFRFDRLTWRELWRYQLARASLDHLAVNDLLLRAGPALMLLLRSEGDHTVPATVRLTSLKGKADPVDHVPGTLRSALRHTGGLRGMVHCADEPADLIRELGVLADAPTRRALVSGLVAGRLDTVHQELLTDLLSRDSAGGIALDSAAALRRITRSVHALKDTERESASIDAVLGHLAHMRRGLPIPWRRFAADLDRLDVAIDPWDLAVVGTAFIVAHEHGVAKQIEGPDPEAWRRPDPASAPEDTRHGVPQRSW